MLRKARAEGAVTAYVHAYYGDEDPLNAKLGIARAFPVDAALGLVDCLEWSGSSHSQLAVWHHALNNDLHVAPVGGEDSISSLHNTKLVGSVRTYAYSGELQVEPWIEAVRKGNTFFSTGPLLEFRVNGHIPGESLSRVSSYDWFGSLAFYPPDKMELSKLTGFNAAVEQAVTDKFIPREPTEAQIKTFVDVLYAGRGQ